MEIREAILKAADHIQANPGEFDFGAWWVPNGCGTPGCAVGWIAHFMGWEAGVGCWNDAARVVGVESLEFMNRMGEVSGNQLGWTQSATECARALRLYADRWHPEETPEQFPTIRAELDRIFAIEKSGTGIRA